MNNGDEKYRIKPRRKYQRQVWLRDGKAIIVDPVPMDPSETEDQKSREKEEE